MNLDHLSPEQRELVLKKLRERGLLPNPAAPAPPTTGEEDSAPAKPRLVPVSRTGPVPLSFAQQRLWFLDQLQPGQATYNLPLVVRLRGPLDLAVLQRSLEAIAQRHEALRTRFVKDDRGTPRQVIDDTPAVPLPLIDLSALDAPLRMARARELGREEADQPFDLATGPLLRTTALRLDPSDHILLLTLHHIIGDGWSLAVLMRELGALYLAFAAGQPSPLVPLPIQYADYAMWQRDWLKDERLAAQLDYWTRQLQGPLPALELPTDHPRPAIASHHGAEHVLFIAPPQVAALQQLSQQHGATLFMTLLAAFQALLHRYTGQTDLIVGTPIAGRSPAALEGLIGFFVNTLAIRTDLSGRPTFSTLLGRVRQATLGAYAHQDLAFEKLVETLAPERDPSKTPVFQVMFALQNMPLPVLEVAGFQLTALRWQHGTAKFDLTLSLEPARGGLDVTLDYRTDLFQAATIERLANHYVRLLEAVCAAPEQAIATLDLLGPAERAALLDRGRGQRDSASYPRNARIESLVAAQAARTPDSPALVFGAVTLSYRALVTRAQTLAQRLRARGIGPGDRVALVLERSPELVITLLGTLQAGATYVPLDPEHPAERLAFMLQDSRAAALVTDRRLHAALGPLDLPVLFIDDDEIVAPAAPPTLNHDVPPTATALDPAYILYTSGSTGRPKGVVVSHRAIVRLLIDTDYIQLEPSDRVAQIANTSFDAATFEIWGALTSGACLVGLPREVTLAPAALAAALRDTGITTMFLTTALFNQIARNHPHAFAPLKHLLFGGEACDPAAVRQVLDAGRPARLLHVYGPTETTTFATWHLVRAVSAQAVTVPIGQPLARTPLYVLDAHGALVPTGVIGELYIGGDGVALGYFDRPALTAERFVPDPFAAEPGARLYRTGDLVRWRLPETPPEVPHDAASPCLEFIGRRDQQIKLRGFRVELGEIESALSQHPAVTQAAVTVRSDRHGHRSLCAYLCTRAPVTPAELRAFVQHRLPDYMIPPAFVFLDALPLTPHGKVDRRALPAPEAAAAAVPDNQQAPALDRTPTEALLCAIMAEVLDRPQVKADDNFFELGGHSLLATQVAARIQQTFHLDLPLQSLFTSPTPAALARVLDHARRDAQGITLPPLVPAPRTGELPLSFAQQRLWFLDQIASGSPLYNVPLAVRLRGPLDLAALRRSLEEVARRHEVLRVRFHVQHGQPVQHVAPELPIPLERVDLSTLDPQAAHARARELAREEALRPFDLATGPLLRARVLALGPDEHLLLLTLHHIVSDGWSLGVLVRELGALYPAFAAGAPATLPPLDVQYADYALWQRSWLIDEALAAQLDHWRTVLGGRLPVLDLPTDHPRPPVETHRGAEHRFTVDAALVQALDRLGRAHGATLYMTLLGAFATLLHRYTGQTDLILGTPIAGRTHTALEPLIGFFVNLLALRTDLSGSPTFQELLARVRHTTLSAYAHQELPFEKLVEALAPERDLSRSPVFQAVFVLQNLPLPALALPGLELEVLDDHSGIAKYELSLSLRPVPEGLQGSLEYNTDLYTAATAARLAEHYLHLLGSIAARPDQEIARLELLDATQERRLREDYSRTADSDRDPDDHARLDALIAAQAARTPDAPAILCGETIVSYATLDQRAAALAQHLHALGAQPETLVALYLDRTPAWVIAVLATLKAGAAWLPLDPSYPAARIAFMLADARPRIVVTTPDLAATLPPHSAQLLLLDAHALDVPGAAPPPIPPLPRPTATADALAYVIYTSGSTGQPKGTLVTHRGLATLARTAAQLQQLGPGRRVLQFAALGFDASVLELSAALTSGATLVLAPRESLLPGPPLRDTVQRHRITSALLPPSVLMQMAPADLPLETLLSGGEACTPELVARWGAATRLLNAYGPTETTVCATISTPLRPGDEPVIGRPWPGATLYVLDPLGQLAPIGVPGELYIGGRGLARGYLDRPALTAARFVPDPFASTPGQRLYRTGDLVCWREGGTLAYLGRIDQQVKLRGIRIELGEIEAVLAQHPAVRQATVLLRRDPPGEPRLVAYLVPADPQLPPEPLDLRTWLKQRLPEAMVPAAYVLLERLPLLPSGKLDRAALPAPERTAPSGSAPFVAPRNDREAQLAALFAELLHLDQVSVDDDFFALGGHSLLSTQAVARIRERLGVELPLRTFFDHPTVAALAQRLPDPSADVPALAAHPRSADPPLSYAQTRLWILDQIRPQSPEYNVYTALAVRGPLSTARLEQSLSEVIRRHEILRTVLRAGPGGLVQIIDPPAPARIDLVDLTPTALTADARDAALAQHLAERTQQPFDLATGPLLRVCLLRLAADHHVLVVTMHHIICDGWSMRVLVDELTAAYEALSQGRAPQLPALPVQYADYALWQRAWLEGRALQAQLDYWSRQLRGPLPVLELLGDRPRPAVQTIHGAEHRFTLAPGLAPALEQLSRRHRVTLFMTLLAAFQTLLHRATGQTDLLVGTPIAGRTHTALEPLIGFFVNTLVLRTDTSGDPAFATLLERVREVTLSAYAHQELPFEKLVEHLAPARDLSRSPLFQVLFMVHDAPPPVLHSAGLTLEPLPLESRTAKFDLTLAIDTSAAELVASFEYNTDLFDAATIVRLGQQLERLLQGIVADPTQPLSALPLLAPAERRLLLEQWSGSRARVPFPWDTRIDTLIAAQVARTPDAIALSDAADNSTLTYRDLAARASQLAHRLRALGVRSETPVLVRLPRSPELVVTLLGILQAGGCYVPLEPTLPAARLDAMLDDIGPAVLVSTQALGAELAARVTATVLLDRDAADLARLPDTPPPVLAGQDAAGTAYILFTSGSTGRPKGVCVPHRAVVRLVHGRFIRFDAAQVFLLLAPVSFDASTLELWGPLVHGGRLAVFPAELPTLDRLAAVLQHERVTTLWLTAALFEQMVVHQGEALAQLPQLLAGGDVLSREHVRQHLARGGRLVNGYGPTENTTFTACHPLTPESPLGATVPIGTPINGTQVYVLDARLEPVPIGLPGELYTGGHGLATGYLRRPALTAERFVPHPFSAAPGQRLYRTGDRVRWRPDGTLEFLGRSDTQIKLRGYRIELGEIEHALARHPQVEQAVAVVRDDPAGERRLIAYVTPATAPVTELRAHLRTHVPEYMVPAAFVALAELPLSPHGKVDRRALPAPALTATPRDPVAPTTPLEQTLCELWARELGLASVSIADHFFEDLGGSSLTVVKVAARLREILGRDIPVTWLFEHPTIAELAQHLSQDTQPSSPDSSPPTPTAPDPTDRRRAQGRNQFLATRRQKKGS